METEIYARLKAHHEDTHFRQSTTTGGEMRCSNIDFEGIA